MMAINKRKNGGREVRFQDHTRKYRSLYVTEKTAKGKVSSTQSQRTAERIEAKVTELAHCRRQSITPSPELSTWIAGLDDRTHAKLALWGMVESRVQESVKKAGSEPEDVLLSDWCSQFIEDKAIKPGTRKNFDIVIANLKSFFNADRTLKSITPFEAIKFRDWLLTKGNTRTKKEDKSLSEDTVRRRIGRSREIFRAAIGNRLLTENPFSGIPAAVGTNEERQHPVPAEVIEKCIKAAGCDHWRAILAFTRYGGMRLHEALQMRWEDVDLRDDSISSMTIRSEKTGTRICPIFPELAVHLRILESRRKSASGPVQSRYDVGSNPGTTLEKIIDRAGVERWPKLFQNLRATCETELLAAGHPPKDVSKWIGHSVPVMMRHYAMAQQESFQDANRRGAQKVHEKVHTSFANSGAISQTLEDPEPTAHEKTPAKTEVSVGCGAPELVSDKHSMTPTGFEFLQFSAGITRILKSAPQKVLRHGRDWVSSSIVGPTSPISNEM